MPGELDGEAAVETFKELVKGVGTMGPKEENFDKMQPEAGFLDSGVKEILFKETHEQVGIGRGHMGAHGDSLNLEEMFGVEGELVSLPLQLMKAAVPAENYVIHLSSASLVSCDVYGQ